MKADAPIDTPFFSDDTRLSPIIVRTLHRHGTDAEFQEHLDTMQSFLLDERHFGFVLDFGDSPLAPPRQRKLQTQWLRVNYAALDREPFGTALVIRRSVERFVLSSIYLVTNIPGRNGVVGTVEDGICFVAAGMLASGHPLPDAVKQIVSQPAHRPAGAVVGAN